MASKDAATQTHARNHADPAPDWAPELYMIDSEVPPDMLQVCVECLRRNPSQPGLSVGDFLKRKSVDDAAYLGVERAGLAAESGRGPHASPSAWLPTRSGAPIGAGSGRTAICAATSPVAEPRAWIRIRGSSSASRSLRRTTSTLQLSLECQAQIQA